MSGRAGITFEDGMVVIRIPPEEVHGLRVALEPCPCTATKSTGTLTIRQRLAKGLAHAMAGRKS